MFLVGRIAARAVGEPLRRRKTAAAVLFLLGVSGIWGIFRSMPAKDASTEDLLSSPAFLLIELKPSPGFSGEPVRRIAHPAFRTVPPEIPFRPKKIFIIATESLNAEFLHCRNAAQIPADATPNIDRLDSQYLSFKNYYMSAAPTCNGLHAVLASRLFYENDLKHTFDSLPGTLEKNGFETRYFCGVPGSYTGYREICRSVYGFRKVFFKEEIAMRAGKIRMNAWGIPDDILFRTALEVMKDNPPDKFLCVISTIDTHPPYWKSGPYRNQAKYSSPFLNSIACYDRNLAEFIDGIQHSALWDSSTLIIVTADHSATHGENFTKRKQLTPARIPLILIAKDNIPARYFPADAFCSQIDLPVTILDLLGIPVPDSFMGMDFRTPGIRSVSTKNGKYYLHSAKKSEEFRIAPAPSTDSERAFKHWISEYYTSTD